MNGVDSENQVQVYFGLLKCLRNMVEQNWQDLSTARNHRDMGLEIFDMLVQMAPTFRSQNPLLQNLLRKRKQIFFRTCVEQR